MISLLRIGLFVVVTTFLTGCLTAGYKEVILNVKPDGTGTGTIRFYDLMSMEEEGENRSINDYSVLVDEYLNGDEFERANPALLNVQKRLLSKDNRLFGEITFEFISYLDVSLFRYHEKGPWMYYIDPSQSSMEKLEKTDGEYAGPTMPAIFWPEETTTFNIITKFDNRDRTTHSLVSLYNRLGTGGE